MITRRRFVGLAGAAALLALSGCATPVTNPSDSAIPEPEPEGAANTTEYEQIAKGGDAMTGSTLIAYFSCTGTTERIAGIIEEATGADMFRIVPQQPYTEADLAYYTGGRADQEQNDPSARPAIAGRIEDMADYDTIILGYPIWHGQAPRIIDTFLESYDLAGRTILPFCTSHSSGLGSSASSLHALASGAHWLEGRRFGADASSAEVEDWLAASGIAAGASSAPASFDLETRQVTLNDGLVMPTNGLGTYSLKSQTCVDSVAAALAAGVRLIDTAYMYGNEAEVGRAIRESGVPRDEVFVITKLYPSQFANAAGAIDEALAKMDIGYVDMMLLHHPGANQVEAYQAMEAARTDGRIRSLGLSCFYVDELRDFLPRVSVKPALVQNEMHPYYQDGDVVDFIHGQDIALQAWYPLGGRGHNAELLSDSTLAAIAAAHGVSVPQVILRWNLQRGVVVIPGSSNPAHIREDASVYGFELSDAEMARIAELNRNEKHDWY